MINRKIIYFLLIFQLLPPGNKAIGYRFLSKLVNRTDSRSTGTKLIPIQADLKCKYKCINANELEPRFQARFIDLGSNDTTESSEMEAPSSKFSFFNLLSDEETDDGEKLKREEEYEEEEDEEEEEEENDSNNDDIDFNLFNLEEEEEEEEEEEGNLGSDKLQGTKGESLLKQYHRHRRRMHNLIFALLLAYKLKFFTVIPLLLGSLVLLIGTTGIAGFFFALFAAALGIHVKGQQH